MPRPRLMVIVFVEMIATAVMERALYFFTADRLGFSSLDNLSLALVFGGVYIASASGSSAVCRRLGQKRALWSAIGGLAVLHVGLAAAAGLGAVGPLVAGAWGVALLTGVKWPAIQSYVAAGRTPRQALGVVGGFNLLWSSAGPVGIACAGPIIGSSAPWAMFIAAAAMNVVTLSLMAPLAPEPTHLAADHPERPPAEAIARYRRLLLASRWGLVASFTMLFLVSPLLPHAFADLGYPVAAATALASLIDVSIVGGFVVLTLASRWHDRRGPIAAGLVMGPVGFLMVLLGGTTAVVIGGEVLMGLGLSMVYYASLYYALTIQNAAVGAGGRHESLIGVGLVLGPALGMLGLGLSGAVGGYVAGMLLGVGPMIAVCLVGGLWPLRKPGAAAPGTARSWSEG